MFNAASMSKVALGVFFSETFNYESDIYDSNTSDWIMLPSMYSKGPNKRTVPNNSTGWKFSEN